MKNYCTLLPILLNETETNVCFITKEDLVVCLHSVVLYCTVSVIKQARQKGLFSQYMNSHFEQGWRASLAIKPYVHRQKIQEHMTN